MNTWEQLALAEVDAAGIFAPTEALDIDEYHAALLDQARVDAMPMIERAKVDAMNAWSHYEHVLTGLYADYMLIKRMPILCRAAHYETMRLCDGKLTKQKQDELKILQQGLSIARDNFRQQKADELARMLYGVRNRVINQLVTTEIENAPITSMDKAA